MAVGKGECSGESKGSPGGDRKASGRPVAVGVTVEVDVGEEVDVALGRLGEVLRPVVGEAGTRSVDAPQADRKAASAAAPAPFRNRRRSIGTRFLDMQVF